jgi:uncharacterized protein YndB with AHSA1/START domain
MNSTFIARPDPQTDLVLERVVDVPRDLVWKAWTTPEQVVQWFTPAPWKTVSCEIDLRPGGAFKTVFRSPEGKDYPNVGCYLDVVEKERLIWTDVLEPGFRPNRRGVQVDTDHTTFLFTAILTLETQGTGTKYTAIALHRSEADRQKHEEMGFHEGWGKALDQLVDMIRASKAAR